MLKIVFLALALLATVHGHGYWSSLTIDGVVHPEDDCIRPHPENDYDYPISQLQRPNGLQSADMTCGWLPSASRPANRKCPVNLGSTITLQWHFERGLGAKDTYYIDPSHHGPCIVYMAKSDTGAGNVWFKIWENGYDQNTKKWCVDTMRANGGKVTLQLPTDIAPGNYLFRMEIIALHEGDQLNGAQPYVSCAELTVGGSGTVNPGNLVAFPGAYVNTDPGIHFDIYTGKNPAYPIPGPKLYVSGSSSAGSSSTTTTTTSTSTTGRQTSTSTTTGRQTSTSTTTGRPASTTTTTGSYTGSYTSTSSSSGSPDALCYLPGTPNLSGKSNNQGTCGKKAPRARCPDGQCCSQWGYCGPIANKDGTYYEYVDGKEKYVSAAFAFQLYCNKTAGDYRKVPCNEIQGGIQSNSILEDKTAGASTLASVEYLRSLLIVGVSLAFIFAGFF